VFPTDADDLLYEAQLSWQAVDGQMDDNGRNDDYTGPWGPEVHWDVVHAWDFAQRAQVRVVDALIEFDRADGWTVDGARSMVAWIKAHLHVSHGQATRLLAQARRLRDFPQLRRALLDGDISWAQADPLINVFTADRAAYAERDVTVLVASLAPLTVSQCMTVARRWADRVDAELAAERAEETGEDGDGSTVLDAVSVLHVSETLDGMVILDGTLNAATGAVVNAALDAALHLDASATGESGGVDHETIEDGSATTPTGDRIVDPRSPAERRADALKLVCQFYLDHYDAVARQYDGGTIGRAHLTVNVDLDILTSKHLIGNGDTPHSKTGIDLRAVLEAACDCSVARVVTAGASSVIDIGRESRVIPPALRKAVTRRDRTCRFPGCDMPAAFTDVHHISHWVRGGSTDRDNCCLLCRRHHTAVHKHGWDVTGNPEGELTFTSPSDGKLRTTRPPNLQIPLGVT
jgi:hypothetical protein